MKYKPSKYNFVKDYSDSKKIIYNTLTSALGLIENENYKLIHKNVEQIECETLSQLLDNGFIVPDALNEKDVINTRLNQARFDKSNLALTFAITRDCNFRCVYCYEKDGINKITANEAVMENILKFVEMKSPSLKSLDWTWYGGEPLLEIDKINQFSKQIQQLCSEKKIDLNQTIVTNGYLLDDDVVQRLVENNIKSLQITIDGPEHYHDSRRVHENGQGSYRKIVDALKKYQDVLNIMIRINVDKENVAILSDLLHEFKSEELNKVGIYLGHVCSINNAYDDDKVLTIEEYSNLIIEFSETLNKLGLMNTYEHEFLYARATFCAADKQNTYVIGPEGELYKCWNELGHKESIIGRLTDDLTDIFKNGNMVMNYNYIAYTPTNDEKCTDCVYLPTCMGGCPHKRIQNQERCFDMTYRIEQILMSTTEHIKSKGSDNQCTSC